MSNRRLNLYKTALTTVITYEDAFGLNFHGLFGNAQPLSQENCWQLWGIGHTLIGYTSNCATAVRSCAGLLDDEDYDLYIVDSTTKLDEIPEDEEVWADSTTIDVGEPWEVLKQPVYSETWDDDILSGEGEEEEEYDEVCCDDPNPVVDENGSFCNNCGVYL